MAIAHHLNVRTRIAADLEEFFAPHGTEPETFDRVCSWKLGTTHDYACLNREPVHAELVEICMRLHVPLDRYFRCEHVEWRHRS